jgi:hypothetical protein
MTSTQDVEMTDRLVAEHDKGMMDLLNNVVVVGSVPQSENMDRTCLDDFPKINIH